MTDHRPIELVVLPSDEENSLGPSKHLAVQKISKNLLTNDYFYFYASNFQTPFFKFMTLSMLQYLRLILGILLSILFTTEIFVSPTDFSVLIANLNWWGLITGFFSLLFQYKAANYEVAKAASADKSKFPDSASFKRMGLQSLEIAMGINFVVCAGYWIFFFPQVEAQYSNSSFKDGMGENTVNEVLWYYRSIIIHTLPFFVCVLALMLTDVTILESDWWLVLLTALAYTLTNLCVSMWLKNDKVYFMDWAVVS